MATMAYAAPESSRSARRAKIHSSISVASQPCRAAPKGTRFGNFPARSKSPQMDLAERNPVLGS